MSDKYKQSAFYFCLLLVIAAISVLIVGCVGYSTNNADLESTAWAKATAFNTTVARNSDVTVYIGLREWAYVYTVDGVVQAGSKSIANSSCLDAGTGSFAILVLVLFSCVIMLLNTLERLASDSERGRWSAAMNGGLATFMIIISFSSWYQQCYINTIYGNNFFNHVSLWHGYYCTVSGFVLILTATVIHASIPGYVPPTYTYSQNPTTFYPTTAQPLPTAVPGPPLAGRVIGVVDPSQPVQGKVIS